MILLIDDETRSYWDHITGKCVHGVSSGSELPNWPIEMTTVASIKEKEPDLPVYVSKLPFFGRIMLWMEGMISGRLPPMFRRTMSDVDDRISEMEIGLGVIDGEAARFYRMSDIQEGVTDTLNGNEIKVSIAADGIPFAVREDGSRPLQLFTRWYGFSLTYPHCQIYEQS